MNILNSWHLMSADRTHDSQKPVIMWIIVSVCDAAVPNQLLLKLSTIQIPSSRPLVMIFMDKHPKFASTDSVLLILDHESASRCCQQREGHNRGLVRMSFHCATYRRFVDSSHMYFCYNHSVSMYLRSVSVFTTAINCGNSPIRCCLLSHYFSCPHYPVSA